MAEQLEANYEVIAETNKSITQKGEETDGEVSYPIEIGNAMLTFYIEEWIEILDLMREILKANERFINVEISSCKAFCSSGEATSRAIDRNSSILQRSSLIFSARSTILPNLPRSILGISVP